jgi:hypothetical protein
MSRYWRREPSPGDLVEGGRLFQEDPSSASKTDQAQSAAGWKEYFWRIGGIMLLIIFEPFQNPYGLALRVSL